MKTLPKKISLLIMLAVMFSIIRPAIAYEHSVSNILELSQAISDANDGDTIILSSNLELNDSSIENSVGQGSVGYDGAVISGPSYYGTLNISNTTFRNNKNAFTGVTGGGGGAIALRYFRGSLNVADSYFVGNSANGEIMDKGQVNAASTYDGGCYLCF